MVCEKKKKIAIVDALKKQYYFVYIFFVIFVGKWLHLNVLILVDSLLVLYGYLFEFFSSSNISASPNLKS